MKNKNKIFIYIFLLMMSIVFVFPFYFMIISATNASVDVTSGSLLPGKELLNNLKKRTSIILMLLISICQVSVKNV